MRLQKTQIFGVADGWSQMIISLSHIWQKNAISYVRTSAMVIVFESQIVKIQKFKIFVLEEHSGKRSLF